MGRRLALLLLPFVLALPLAVAACGGGDEDAATDEAAAAEPAETVEVRGTEFAFEPAEITLDAPGTYRFVFTNDGGAPHALAIEGNGVDAATGTIAGGETAEVEVTLDEGEYEIYCPVGNHAAQGMVGRILVGGGAAGATTQTETETETESGTDAPDY